MKFLFVLTMIISSLFSIAQKPKNGTYKYSIIWEEFGGKSLGATCTVIIKGDAIKVVHDGNKNLTGNKGDILDEGIIMKHQKTGKWIIGRSQKDKSAKEIGGCGDGPTVIDFKKKTWLGC